MGTYPNVFRSRESFFPVQLHVMSDYVTSKLRLCHVSFTTTPVKRSSYFLKGVSEETVVLRRRGVLQDNLVLSTELIMRIGHRKEI